MELHTCLWNDVEAFHFYDADFDVLRKAIPGLKVIVHNHESNLFDEKNSVEAILTWNFESVWYEKLPNLKWIITPAAGKDWVQPDPLGKVKIIYGNFHGKLLCESLLSALFYMNHQMPKMVRNFEQRAWDRDIQSTSTSLSNQTILIIGFGNIGQKFAKLLCQLGSRVIGISRSITKVDFGTEVYPVVALSDYLPEADHVVLLLPGGQQTERFMNKTRLERCKKGAYIYNFGRGNALYAKDLVACWEHLGGAFLDVVEEEPLPIKSELWGLENIMITPHSSCVYSNYKEEFLKQILRILS